MKPNARHVRLRLGQRLLDELAWRGWYPHRHAANTGPVGERLAARWLQRRGFRVLARNLRIPSLGEIDLLTLSPERATLVVVEVKARLITSDTTGRAASGTPDLTSPEHRVGRAKRRRLAALAQAAAQRYHLADHPLRVDVVGVDIPQHGPPVVRHVESVPP